MDEMLQDFLTEAGELLSDVDNKLVELEKYWEAIQLLEPALPAVQGKVRLRGQLLLARSKAKNPNWVKQAEELLLTATRENPQAVDGWALLASI